MITLHLIENIPFMRPQFGGAVCGKVYIEKPASYSFFTLSIPLKK
jgi:hypothetical protein